MNIYVTNKQNVTNILIIWCPYTPIILSRMVGVVRLKLNEKTSFHRITMWILNWSAGTVFLCVSFSVRLSTMHTNTTLLLCTPNLKTRRRLCCLTSTVLITIPLLWTRTAGHKTPWRSRMCDPVHPSLNLICCRGFEWPMILFVHFLLSFRNVCLCSLSDRQSESNLVSNLCILWPIGCWNIFFFSSFCGVSVVLSILCTWLMVRLK